MKRGLLTALLAITFGIPLLSAQSRAVDPEIKKGIAAFEDGDYDGAILILDTAARRLSGDPKRLPEVSEAYLHLGLAYLAKGSEAAARAQFREALLRTRDLMLSPDKYPPKVVDLFESARQDLRREGTPAAGAAEQPKKKKGNTGLILIGVGGAAAAGVAVAAGGGGGDGGSGTGGTTPPPSTTVTESFSGALTQANPGAQIVAGPAGAAGQWSAQLTWTGSGDDMIHWFVVDASNDQGMGEPRLLTPNSGALEWNGAAGARYRIDIFLQQSGPPTTSYELRVTRPR